SKMLLQDEVDRHCGLKAMYYSASPARNTLAFYDGSAGSRYTRDANQGMQPNNPTGTTPTQMTYDPTATPWMPPTFTGAPSEIVTAYYRYTRSGLRGVDFGGTEVRGNGY